MVKIKLDYLVEYEKEVELTTREWGELHASRENLRKLLAEESRVDEKRIVIRDDYCKIIDGKLDYKNLDK